MTALIARLAQAPAQDAPPLLPGARVGRYEIVRTIGCGGFGTVYEAYDSALKRLVALKVLRTDGCDRAAAHEGEAAARLAHQNIAAIHDAGVLEGGSPYLVYEILHGETLDGRLARGPIPPRDAVAIAVQVARALVHAHSHGVVHRDLKPANVFLTTDGQVKVLDFGLALVFGRPAPGGGTPAYMAPEQRRGEPEDARTDLYALGALLRDMLNPEHDRPEVVGSDLVPPCVRSALGALLQEAPAARPRGASTALAQLEAAADMLAPTRSARRRYAVAVAYLALAAVIGAGSIVLVRSRRPALVADTPPPSIAVLPFADLSPGRDQDYFSDGLADEVRNALAHVEGLRVAGRTSAFSFKGKPDDLRTIAQRLNVGAVLEGSVRRAGTRIRVTAQLVSAADGYHLWSETYDRELSDVFAVQDEIARAVVAALQIELLPGREPTTRTHRTARPEVYNHYLLGRQHYYRNSEAGYRDAVAEYRKALALDPGYAPAWAGLTVPLYELVNHEPTLERAEALRRASLQAGEKAVTLAPDLADGWAARGVARSVIEYDWSGARSDLEKAIALNPGDPHARRWLGTLLTSVGRLDMATAAFEKAVELDPLSPQNWVWLSYVYSVTGRLEPARDAARRIVTRFPESAVGPMMLAKVELLAGRPAAALEVLARCDDEQLCLLWTSIANRAVGNALESDRALNVLVSKYPHVHALHIAMIHATRGEVDRAFGWLERAVAQRESIVPLLKTIPELRPLRDDARFAALVRKMNLPTE